MPKTATQVSAYLFCLDLSLFSLLISFVNPLTHFVCSDHHLSSMIKVHLRYFQFPLFLPKLQIQPEMYL